MIMTEQEMRNRELIIAIVATRQAAELGYKTGFEDRAVDYDDYQYLSALDLN